MYVGTETEMIDNRAGILWSRALSVLRRQGPASFLKQTMLYLLTNGLTRKSIYLYENDFSHIPEFLPRAENCELRVIYKPSEVDDLLAKSYDFASYRKFYRDMPELKATLAKGAILFAAFVDRQLAHTTWVALTESAKQDIDSVPYKVDFEAGEVCSGDSETNPKFRRLGLYPYVYSNIFTFLKREGHPLDRFAIEKNNTASNHTLEKFGSRIYAEGRLIRFLLWSFWREKPAGNSRQGGAAQ